MSVPQTYRKMGALGRFSDDFTWRAFSVCLEEVFVQKGNNLLPKKQIHYL